MPRKHILKNVPPEKLQQLEALRAEVARFERKGLTDTAHHTMLRRLESELGLITNRKTEEQKDEVTHGEQNL